MSDEIPFAGILQSGVADGENLRERLRALRDPINHHKLVSP